MARKLSQARIDELVKRHRPIGWRVRQSEHRWTWSSATTSYKKRTMYVPTLEMLLEMENLAVCGARLTHDHQEGVEAFKAKRQIINLNVSQTFRAVNADKLG